ncbi:MAG: hypothetical protein CMF75_02740 [Maricaulis sp.]|nr:hypothetical protein [Maricaulis sp.]
MPTTPRIETVEQVFNGQAVMIRLAGLQTVDFATPIRKLVYWLSSKGIRHFIYDLRKAQYVTEDVHQITEYIIAAARVMPRFHVAILHQGENPTVVQALIKANKTMGNAVVDVRSLDEARNWMFPGLVDPVSLDDDTFDLDSLDRRSA